MKNRGIFPVKIKKTPIGRAWDNIAAVLWEFYARYIAAEGLAESSQMARPVLMYIFHGSYRFLRTIKRQAVSREMPIIHGLHFKLISQQSRFSVNIGDYFVDFISLYDDNPKWERFFDDKGAGSPPLEYLIAVEHGLREVALGNCKYTIRALRSKKAWSSVAPWRKMEAYICLIRHIRKRDQYSKWHDYKWDDFNERNKLGVTFRNRHLKWSNGQDFNGRLKDPPSWNESNTSVSKNQKKKKSTKTVKCKSEPKTKVSDPLTPLRFDPESGSLMEIVDLTS